MNSKSPPGEWRIQSVCSGQTGRCSASKYRALCEPPKDMDPMQRDSQEHDTSATENPLPVLNYGHDVLHTGSAVARFAAAPGGIHGARK